jgi:hypothetical protein
MGEDTDLTQFDTRCRRLADDLAVLMYTSALLVFRGVPLTHGNI